MFIHDVHAGVISDAPPVAELLLSVLNFLLQVGAALTILGILVAGILYITSADSMERREFAQKALFGSIIGLVIILISLGVVTTLVRVL